MTLSCKVGSMRLRPEWPWRARRYKIAPGEVVQYWYLFFVFLLLLPCFSSTFRQTNDDSTRNVFEDCHWFSRIQSLHHFLVVHFHDEEDESIFRHFMIGDWIFSWFNIGPTSFPQYVLVEEPAVSRLCGFALAFDRLAKSPAFNLNAYSSNCTSEVSCSLSSLLFKFVTNFV